MGFLKVLRKLRQKEKESRILFLGLDNAGKTTILRKICGEETRTVEPTLGFAIKTVEHGQYKLNCWDVGGQRSLRSFWRNYFEQTDAVVWVVDSADRLRLDDCRKELHELLVEERLAGATLLILANKQDLPGALSANQIRGVLRLDEIQTHNWCIHGTSAVVDDAILNKNISTGIDWMINDIAERIFDID